MIGRRASLVFRRHGEKVSTEKQKASRVGKRTGLQWKGLRRAFWKGVFNRGRTEFASTDAATTRTNWSARAARLGHRLTGGKTTGPVKLKPYLGYYYIKDMGAAIAEVKRLETRYGKDGADDAYLRRWLDGKVSPRIMLPPAQVADDIIRKEVESIKNSQASNVQNYINRWTVEAILERLAGARFDSLIRKGKKTKGVDFTEPLKIGFTKKGRAILRYRGYKFDVTERIKEITGA